MLNRKEKIMLNYILETSSGKSTCLFTALDLQHALEPRYSTNIIEIEAILEMLAQENYITLVNSDKNGEIIYCITVLQKGKSIHKTQKSKRRMWVATITKTVLLAVLSFAVGLVLKLIFYK